MKYARRSVSDQDIRRYEMFSQVRFISFSAYCPYTEPLFFCRTYNNPVDLGTTSSSRKATVKLALRLPRRVMQGSRMTPPTMICTLKAHEDSCPWR